MPHFTIPVTIDAKIFRSFALFDNLRLRRRWRAPALFAGILTLFACLCFAFLGRLEQAGLLGGVLLTVGLGLPMVWFLSFFLDLRRQIKKLGLDCQPKAAYTLALSAGAGVAVTAGNQEQRLVWDQMFGAFRVPGCIYLYAAPTRAYLLPDGQIEGGADPLWALLTAQIPAGRTRDYRP